MFCPPRSDAATYTDVHRRRVDYGATTRESLDIGVPFAAQSKYGPPFDQRQRDFESSTLTVRYDDSLKCDEVFIARTKHCRRHRPRFGMTHEHPDLHAGQCAWCGRF